MILIQSSKIIYDQSIIWRTSFHIIKLFRTDRIYMDFYFTFENFTLMLRVALFHCVINENCCSEDWGWGICPLFLSPIQLGIRQLKCHSGCLANKDPIDPLIPPPVNDSELHRLGLGNWVNQVDLNGTWFTQFPKPKSMKLMVGGLRGFCFQDIRVPAPRNLPSKEKKWIWLMHYAEVSLFLLHKMCEIFCLFTDPTPPKQPSYFSTFCPRLLSWAPFFWQ